MAFVSLVCSDKVSLDVHGLTGNRCVPIHRRAADCDEIVLASQGTNHFTQARPCNFLWDRLLFVLETKNTCRSSGVICRHKKWNSGVCLVSPIENGRLQAFGAVQPAVNACLHAPDLGFDIQFFLIVVIGSDQVSNSQAAIQVFANDITQPMAPTAAFAGH